MLVRLRKLTLEANCIKLGNLYNESLGFFQKVEFKEVDYQKEYSSANLKQIIPGYLKVKKGNKQYDETQNFG